MQKLIRGLRRFFRSPSVNFAVTEDSTPRQIAFRYPFTYDYLLQRFGVRLQPADMSRPLREVVAKYALPPPQILFAEIQLQARASRIALIGPAEAKTRFFDKGRTILDVRESWEWKMAPLPGARELTPPLWNEMIAEWKRDTPLLLFCHFGVRSTDAANQLADHGFTGVHVMRGGIDAWSLEVDPDVPRYEGAWC